MKTLAMLQNQNYIFNHLIYDNSLDKHFAKHSHSLYEIIYILNGEVDYIIEDRLYRAKKHDLIFIKPYTYHYFTIKSGANYEKIGILFNADYLNVEPSTANYLPELLNCAKHTILNSIFSKFNFYYNTFPEETFSGLLVALIKEIILNLSLITEQTVSPQYHTPILSPVLKYINENLFSIHTLEDVSSALNISTSYLKAIFKKELKIQPKKYINEKKLLMARQLIFMGEKATAACEKCGFMNYSTFYRLYLAYFGIAPSADLPLNGKNFHHNP